VSSAANQHRVGCIPTLTYCPRLLTTPGDTLLHPAAITVVPDNASYLAAPVARPALTHPCLHNPACTCLPPPSHSPRWLWLLCLQLPPLILEPLQLGKQGVLLLLALRS
jgi:hypothetical protein